MPLAVLNLMRSWRMQLPAGRDVAGFMGIPPMVVNNIENQLWVYILKEAGMASQTGGNGTELGSVGSRIVAEVFAGLLLGDPSSFGSLMPEWTPAQEPVLQSVLGAAPLAEDWELADIIQAIGVPVQNADFAAINAALVINLNEGVTTP